jgi:dTDP-4-dehydrorhamnose reductase
MRPVLVLGRSGQLAIALSHVDLGPAPVIFAGRESLDLEQVGDIEGHIRAINPGLIINAAAYTAVDKAQSEPERAIAINSEAVKAIALTAASIDCPLIHISTDYVFDGVGLGAYRENDPTAPQSVYGHTKRAGELAIEQSGARYVILRTSWVFSPWGTNFVKTMLRLGNERDQIGVVADQTGRPTYAPDLALWISIIIRKIDAGHAVWGTFHAANDGVVSWADFAVAIFEEAAARGAKTPQRLNRITTAEYPTPAKRPANSVLSTNKLVQAYDIELRHWRVALAECLDQILTAGRTA